MSSKVNGMIDLRGLSAEEARMINAVRRASRDVTFTVLALQARVPRRRVRPILDELVRKRRLRVMTDGWYERVK